MSVNWLWKFKMGTITVSQKLPAGGPESTYKVNMYSANCTAALIYEYKDKETHKNMYQFWGFWNDIQHLKNCLGMSKGHNSNIYAEKHCKIVKIRLNTYYKEMIKVAELFAKTGVKVELYYENPLSQAHYEVINEKGEMITWDISKKVCQNYISERGDNYHIVKVKRGTK